MALLWCHAKFRLWGRQNYEILKYWNLFLFLNERKYDCYCVGYQVVMKKNFKILKGVVIKVKQGQTGHIPTAHPVVLRAGGKNCSTLDFCWTALTPAPWKMSIPKLKKFDLALPPSLSLENVQTYPRDLWILPYPLGTLKCSHTLLNWPSADFF